MLATRTADTENSESCRTNGHRNTDKQRRANFIRVAGDPLKRPDLNDTVTHTKTGKQTANQSC